MSKSPLQVLTADIGRSHHEQEKERLQMGSTKTIGKTIGEVEKLISIPKRKLKYMIERNLMQPSRRSETSFWLYSKQDIQTVRTISLLQQLGYSENSIRSILAAPAAQWPESLEQQITQLIEKRNHIEDQLFLAELLRYRGNAAYIPESFSANDSHPSGWATGEKEALCQFLYQTFSETEPETPLHQLSHLPDTPPDNPAIQAQIRKLCDLFGQHKAISPSQLLLILRLAHTLSGLVPILNALLRSEGAVQRITAALQYYCEHQQESL
mgnify:CR=1 FL=1